MVVPFSSTFLHTFIEKWRNPLPLRSAFLRRLIKLCTDWLRSQYKFEIILKMRRFICYGLANASLTFLFWCCANYLKYLSLYYLIRNHFQFVQCVRFDFDYQASVPSTKWNKIKIRNDVRRKPMNRDLPFAVMRLLYPFVLVLTMTVLMLMTYPLIAKIEKEIQHTFKYTCWFISIYLCNYFCRMLRNRLQLLSWAIW